MEITLKIFVAFVFLLLFTKGWLIGRKLDAVVTITVPDHPVIEVRLDAHQNKLNMCAIAMLENNYGELKLTKLSEYFNGHIELDKHYKWGIRWAAGSK
ncbi:MAG: hypothetical protein QX189_04825 [Methylococcales bacterium]